VAGLLALDTLAYLVTTANPSRTTWNASSTRVVLGSAVRSALA
jgi:hypothetical protein